MLHSQTVKFLNLVTYISLVTSTSHIMLDRFVLAPASKMPCNELEFTFR